MKRRSFLEMSLGFGASVALGATGRLVRVIPFVGEGEPPVDRTIGSGLGGRRYLDLAGLDAASLVTSSEKFFIRTRVSDQLHFDRPWTIRLHGLVKAPLELTMDQLAPLAGPAGVHLLECSGNDWHSHFGMMSAARWTGVALSKLLDQAGVLPGATQILVSGFDRYSRTYPGSEPGASWVFRLEDLLASKAFLATAMNGAALSPDHGFPVRLVVPGWYGCAWVKWANEIVLVGGDAPATDQMREFAGRTHQRGTPELARDYEPATIDLAALPVRVEQWLAGGKVVYRIAGILWGGSRPTRRLVIRLGDEGGGEPVSRYDHRTNLTWTLWSHPWRPGQPGEYSIDLRVDDATVRTRRLDSGHYRRRVRIEEV